MGNDSSRWVFDVGGSFVVVDKRDDGSAVLSMPGGGSVKSVVASVAKGASVEKRAVPFKSFPTDSSEWVEADERGKASVEDLLLMAGWHGDTTTDQPETYLFLHHRADGHNVSLRGLQEAMTSLVSGDDLPLSLVGMVIPSPDRKAVWEHLARHYREDFSLEPPEFRDKAEKPSEPSNLIRTLDQLREFFGK